jgi:hypothetical protein
VHNCKLTDALIMDRNHGGNNVVIIIADHTTR